MSNDNSITVITPKSLDEARSLSSHLAKASMLPVALRGKEADVLMTIMAGSELGLGPIQSIRSIHIIDGKPTLSADLIAALCMRSSDVCEYLTPVETTATKATYSTKRKGSPSPVTLSFTIEQARAAGLAGKGNWAKYPEAMLRARCISAICRAVYPDLVGGLYDPDELDRPEPRDVTPVIAEVVDAKPKRRMNIVDEVPAEAPPGPVAAESMTLASAIDAAKTTAELTALTMRLRALPEAERAALRPAYDARLKAVGA